MFFGAASREKKREKKGNQSKRKFRGMPLKCKKNKGEKNAGT